MDKAKRKEKSELCTNVFVVYHFDFFILLGGVAFSLPVLIFVGEDGDGAVAACTRRIVTSSKNRLRKAFHTSV